MQRHIFITLSVCLLIAADAKEQKDAKTNDAKPARVAALGAKLRAPSSEETTKYGLTHLKQSANGLYLNAIDKGGAAEKAGLNKGDVLLALDQNNLYSQDDLADFLRVSHPGSKVRAVVKRADTFKEGKVTLTLDAIEEADRKHFTWQYASLGQLEKAIAAAKREGKLVLVGLSGADT
jgi:S1-C subfamily serine protease